VLVGVDVSTIRRWRQFVSPLLPPAPSNAPVTPAIVLPVAEKDRPAPDATPLAPMPSLPSLPSAPPPDPITTPDEFTPEELADTQAIISDVMDYRKDLIRSTATGEGLDPNHPDIKKLGERSRLGKLSFNRGAKAIAPVVAKIKPWQWLIIGAVAEFGSMLIAVITIKKTAADARERRDAARHNPAPPPGPSPVVDPESN